MRTNQKISLTRRALVVSFAPGAALAVSGCASTSGIVTTSVPQWVTALQAIGTEVSTILPVITSAANIPAATVQSITAIIADIQSALSGVSAASSQSAGASVLQTVENYINDLAPLVAPFLSAVPGVGPVIGLIVAALPAIEAAVGIVSTLVTSQAASLASLAPAPAASAKLRGTLTASASQPYMNLLIKRAAALKG